MSVWTNEHTREPWRLLTRIRWWWWRLTAGALIANWRLAHQHKLSTFSPEDGKRLTYTFRLFTPEFDPASGASIGTQGVMVEAYPWCGGTVFQWLPTRTAHDLFVEERDRAFAPGDWEGRLEATISMVWKF